MYLVNEINVGLESRQTTNFSWVEKLINMQFISTCKIPGKPGKENNTFFIWTVFEY